MDFSIRHRENELMDDSGLSADALRNTYADIDRANRLLGGDRGVLEAIEDLVSENPKEQYSIIDIGCGNGAILRKVCQFFRKKGLKVKLLGIDLNDKAIVLAKEASKDFTEISYQVVDVLQREFIDLKQDLVISTLTMHHIPEDKIPAFLIKLTNMACFGIIINDLQRSRSAYYLYRLFSAIFIKTKIAKNDGLVSIRSGFTKKELFQYSRGFSRFNHSIRSKWAFRYVWVMRVKQPTTTKLLCIENA